MAYAPASNADAICVFLEAIKRRPRKNELFIKGVARLILIIVFLMLKKTNRILGSGCARERPPPPCGILSAQNVCGSTRDDCESILEARGTRAHPLMGCRI